ncbi:hypothetical protein [Thiobacter aerophilum]|uniref:Uncharacterized protein n=1 Tax=Thiobacter aerophilum TaxID=3121275 RepID=A0ABV0EBR2_9BURK
MSKANPYESEADILIRTLREDPRIETERSRNWAYWWQRDRRQRDQVAASLDVDLAPPERDMAYAARRADVVGGLD